MRTKRKDFHPALPPIKAPLNIKFILLLVAGVLGAQEGWDAEWTLGTGLVWGTANEIVYQVPRGKDLLSLLVWDIPPSVGPRLEASFQSPWLWYFSLGFLGAFPARTGRMTNSDWITSPNTAPPDIFSESTVFLTTYWEASLQTGVQVPANEYFSYNIFLSAHYSHASWEGWNSVQTTRINPIRRYLFGHTIDYRQSWVLPGVGLAAEVRTDSVLFRLSATWNPWLFFQARDIHILRQETFLDTAFGGWGWTLHSEAGLRFWEGWMALLRFDYSFWQSAHADTLRTNNGMETKAAAFSLSRGTAGGDLMRFGLFAGLRFVLE